jgi:hypothetical protein
VTETPPGPGWGRRLGRGAVLAATGALVAGGLALVGAPPAPTTTGDSGPTTTKAGVLEGARLNSWCQRAVDATATAEFVGLEWWCAGRPGGIWRMERLDLEDACRETGLVGRRRTVTDQAVDCAGPALSQGGGR